MALTCAIREGSAGTGLTGGGVGDKETRVAWRTGLLLPWRGKLQCSFDSLTADLRLDPFVHELSLRHTPIHKKKRQQWQRYSSIKQIIYIKWSLTFTPVGFLKKNLYWTSRNSTSTYHYLSLRVTGCVGVEVVTACTCRSRFAARWTDDWKYFWMRKNAQHTFKSREKINLTT